MMNNYKTNVNLRKWSGRAILCLALVMFFGSSVKAQLAMTRSTFAGAFTPITTGGGATAYAGAVGDDVVATAIPIGFSFDYLGTAYTTFTACSNGWMSFTATGSAAGNANLYTATAPNATLAPWWDDLSSSELLAQTTGTAGSQVCTIQWTSLSYFTTSTRTIRYQVKLYEGTNVIEFIYEPNPAGTLYSSESASIGIESATGGNGQYLDAVTGSAFTGNGTLQSDRWPTYNFRFTPGAPSPIAAGTYNVGIGQTYINLNEAVADINHRGISGAVTLNLTDVQYDISSANGGNFFPILVGPVTGSNGTNTITISKIGTPAIISYGGASGTNGFIVNQASTSALSSNTDPIIGLVGADYVTIDNLDIRGNVNNQLSDHGVGVYNSSATDGATNNIIQNVTVTMSRSNTGSRGFFSNVVTTPSAASGANSNNTYRNFTITNVNTGIQLSGNGTNPDLGTVIGNTVCTNFNTIGNPSQANDIGNNASTAAFGIRVTNQSGISIYNNSIRNVTSSAAQADGIFVETFQGTSAVYNNKIQTIKNAGTSSTTAISGIRASQTNTGTHTLRIYNNTVSEIISAYTGAATATRTLKGIYVNSAGGGANTQVYQMHNNSVSIDGSSSLNLSSACFEIGGTGGPVFNLSNNVFANFTATQTGVARHAAIYSTSATTFGPAGSTSDNNDLYVQNDLGTTGFVVNGNGTGYNTPAAWSAAATPAGLEAASISVNPSYVSNTSDLHATNLALNGVGQAYQAYVTNDLECAARTPDNDLGAYILTGCSGTPTAGTITGTSAVCSGLGTTLTLSGASTDAGVTYQWASSTVAGGPYTNMGTSGTQATGALSATTYYIVTVTCTSSGNSVATPEYTVTVNPLPTVAANPATALYCAPGTGVSITASGASTYSWTPSTGLSATSGAAVVASPASTTTYTVTGTDANGCVNTATSAITVGNKPTITSVTATPNTVCSGANSQLNVMTSGPVNQYQFSTSTGGALDPMTGATTVIGTSVDDTPTGSPSSIGFTFNFNGVGYTQYSVSPDGWILLGGATAAGQFGNAVTSTTNIPKIYPYWDDLATGTNGNVQTLVTGSAPNRIFIVQWFVTIPRNTTGAANSTFQAWLYENDGRIEFHYGTMGSGAMTSSVGLTGNATNYNSVTVSSNTNSTTTANDNNAGQPASGTIYTFTPPIPTYSWSPATFLNNTTISNPMASAITASTNYTVTVTSAAGCSSIDSVMITAGAALTSSANITANDTLCAASNATLHAVPAGGGAPYTYAWTGPNGFTSMAQDTTINNITVAQTGTYTVTITDACSASSVATVSLTVNALPVVTATPDSSVICLPGGSAISLSATGANTYAWAPAAGLSATTGAAVTANPASSTSYTITGTDINGCISRDTVVVQVSDAPSILTMSANPTEVCLGGSSQLNVSAASTLDYTVAPIPYALIATPGAGVTTLCSGGTATTALSAGSLDDGGWYNRALPFTFTFFGTTYNSFAVSSNGFITLGAGTPNTNTGYYTNFPDPACGRPSIGPMYADLDFRTTGKIEYFVTGTAPNRRFVVNFNGQFYSGSGSFNTQVIMYESSNIIDVHTTSSTGDNEAVQGIQNAAGTQAVTVPGRNNSLWTVSTPDAYRFTPSAGTFTYNWTPAGNLDNATISNPLASGLMTNTTFSVTVTSDLGCTTDTTVTVNVNPLSAVNITSSGSTTICAGDSVDFVAVPVGGGPYTYSWTPGGSTNDSLTVIPSVTTVYTVTVNNTCGETVTNTVTVTVNTLPVVTATAGGTLYCTPGSPAIPIVASGANAYVWAPAAGLDITNGTSVNATPSMSTTYTVTGTDVNGCIDTATVMITAAPAIQGLTATATPSTICANDTVTLGSTATTAYTVFSDDFNGATSSWTEVNSSVGGTPAAAAWIRQTSPFVASWGTTINSNDNKFYMSSSDAQGSGSTTNVTLTSPRIDVSGAATLTLNFKHYYRYTATTSENASVSVSTDNMNWTVVQTYTATTGAPTAFAAAALNLDAYAGNDSLYIRYSYKSNWGYGWAIDNVDLTGTLATLNYAWTSAPAGFASSVAAPIATPPVTTDYMLNVSNAFGCSAADTVTVTVNALPVVTLGNDTAVCSVGLPLALDAGNAGNTYMWSTSETTQTISASSAGSYDVAVTDANGCVGMDTIIISINPTPVVALGTDTIRCGGSVTLDAGNAGATYVWNDMSTGQTLVATTSGQYDVTVTSADGCEGADTINVTINPVPSMNLGNDTLFCGTSLTLDAGNPGATYFWNTTETTQTINVTTSGQYFVDVTNAQNCSSVDTINVTIAPAITVDLGNDSAICQNTSLFLDAQNVGSTYLWSDNSTSSTLTVTDPGTYYVTVTSTDGCVAMDTIVFADNSPVVTLSLPFTTTCVNTSVNTLSGGSPSGGFYSGTGVTGTNFNATTVGNFVISYTYTDGTTGCAATDTQTVVVDPCIGVKEVSALASIVVAPNPNTGNFSIMMPSRELTAKAEMYTLDGKLIYSETLKDREVYEVNITNLANAIYYLRLTVDGETNVIKVVKQD